MHSRRVRLGRALTILVGLAITCGALGQTRPRRTRPPLDILEDRTPRPTRVPTPAPAWSSAWIQFGLRNATDVAVGANGVVWIIGNDPAGAADKNIYRWDGNTFQQTVGAAVRIAVDPNGKAWVVKSSGSIFRWVEPSWQEMPGKAMDIGIGANGDVWVIDVNGSIFKWDGNNWRQIQGGGTRIAVDPLGNPWVVNAGGQIWHWKGTSWELLPGSAKDITVGPDGAVLIVSTNPAAGGFQVQLGGRSLGCRSRRGGHGRRRRSRGSVVPPAGRGSSRSPSRSDDRPRAGLAGAGRRHRPGRHGRLLLEEVVRTRRRHGTDAMRERLRQGRWALLQGLPGRVQGRRPGLLA